MSSQVNLTDRQQRILRATVRHYIATAEPVGSKALVEEYNLSVSPATIRNVFGLLEKAGLLYQPHTSAGRIPSDSGYRIYVDRLMTPANKLGSKVEQLLVEQLKKQNTSFEALLRGAAQILATLSGYITLITLPQNRTACLRHLQLLPVDDQRVMLIVVTDSYETTSALMDLPPTAEPDRSLDAEMMERELQILSNFLNSQLRGKPLSELAALDWKELDREFQRYADFCQQIFSELGKRANPPLSTPIMVRGVSEVLRQPEFAELQQVQALLHLLEEEQEQLWPLIFELPQHYSQDLCSKTEGSRVTVRIGTENPLEPMRTCALISANYCQGKVPVGSIGVIGPTRMFYENAIALVEAAADYFSEALS
ncbi:MAG: heat-inducible transcriptional repressor HrcA [Cyanosarcina radialis HA8281-LM2]|jgi:heat-inducible transcriptional repressor|nr:heat-inducible transcriptional repressor HrcA [Cyanosarcina radialis HA8281-LM2]